MKKIKTIAALILTVILIAAVGGTVLYVKNKDKDDSIPLGHVLEDASELTTQKMVITDVYPSQKGNIPFLTKNKFLIQYKTTVIAGFDVSEATVKESEDQVLVTIPHCRIDEESIKIKSEDLKFYDTNFALIRVDTDGVLELINEAEEKAKEQASSDEYGFLEAADENAVKIVRQLYENAVDGKEVVVEFKE